jgi:hypothetical protein
MDDGGCSEVRIKRSKVQWKLGQGYWFRRISCRFVSVKGLENPRGGLQKDDTHYGVLDVELGRRSDDLTI